MAKAGVAFSQDTVTDQKRLVRGEHLLLARSLLQGRDGVHHAKWSVAFLAGGVPKEEINAIRELMPKAIVTAIDKDPECLNRAIEAGVDDVIEADISEPEVRRGHNRYSSTSYRVNPGLSHLSKTVDVLDLDLCTNANRDTRDLIKLNYELLAPGGILLLTFSYGRDVVPLFDSSWYGLRSSFQYHRTLEEKINKLLGMGAPESILKRVAFLFNFGNWKPLDGIRSLMLYQGRSMPMCSVLLQRVNPAALTDYISFLKVGDGDFELAVVYPESIDLYACPQERVEALRRQFPAIKAAYTRKEKARPVPSETQIWRKGDL